MTAQRLADRYAAVPLLRIGQVVSVQTDRGARRYLLAWGDDGPYLQRVTKRTKKPQAALAKPMMPR